MAKYNYWTQGSALICALLVCCVLPQVMLSTDYLTGDSLDVQWLTYIQFGGVVFGGLMASMVTSKTEDLRHGCALGTILTVPASVFWWNQNETEFIGQSCLLFASGLGASLLIVFAQTYVHRKRGPGKFGASQATLLAWVPITTALVWQEGQSATAALEDEDMRLCLLMLQLGAGALWFVQEECENHGEGEVHGQSETFTKYQAMLPLVLVFTNQIFVGQIWQTTDPVLPDVDNSLFYDNSLDLLIVLVCCGVGGLIKFGFGFDSENAQKRVLKAYVGAVWVGLILLGLSYQYQTQFLDLLNDWWSYGLRCGGRAYAVAFVGKLATRDNETNAYGCLMAFYGVCWIVAYSLFSFQINLFIVGHILGAVLLSIQVNDPSQLPQGDHKYAKAADNELELE